MSFLGELAGFSCFKDFELYQWLVHSNNTGCVHYDQNLNHVFLFHFFLWNGSDRILKLVIPFAKLQTHFLKSSN